MTAGTRSAPAHDVTVERGLMIPMRDGARLAADLYRPDGPAHLTFPTIVERTPYDRGMPDYRQAGHFFASRGYAVLVQDVRGRHGSEGEFHFFFNPHHEGLDGHDTVEWAAAQPWSTGRIGTTGLSFSGANQHALAITRPPHLTAQLIRDAGLNYWRQYLRYDGAFSAGIHFPYALHMAHSSREAAADPVVKAALRHALEHLGDWMRRLPVERGGSPLALVPSYEDWYLFMATRGDFEGEWLNPQANLEAYIEEHADIPVLLITGWYGHHAAANLDKYVRLRARSRRAVKLVCGTWMHGYELETSIAGEVCFGDDDPAPGLHEYALRWFDAHLKGVDTGIAEEPPVSIYVMGGGSGERTAGGHLMHGGRWQELQDWPPPGVEPAAYHLHAGGSLCREPQGNDVPPTTYVFDPADPVPTIGGQFREVPTPGGPPILAGGAWDQRGRAELAFCRDELPLASRPDVLVFRSEPLDRPVTVIGAIEARLWVSSSCPDTDFTVKLVDEYPPGPDRPHGYAMNLCDAIARLRYRGGRLRGEPAVPGEVYELVLRHMATANLFERGHRIRVDVSSSNFPRYDVNPNTGGPLGLPAAARRAVNSLHHDAARPSRILLPVMDV